MSQVSFHSNGIVAIYIRSRWLSEKVALIESVLLPFLLDMRHGCSNLIELMHSEQCFWTKVYKTLCHTNLSFFLRKRPCSLSTVDVENSSLVVAGRYSKVIFTIAVIVPSLLIDELTIVKLREATQQLKWILLHRFFLNFHVKHETLLTLYVPETLFHLGISTVSLIVILTYVSKSTFSEQ